MSPATDRLAEPAQGPRVESVRGSADAELLRVVVLRVFGIEADSVATFARDQVSHRAGVG